MRIAISNLAWEPSDDVAVAEILREAAVDAIDIAPGKYFSDLPKATEADAHRVRQAWASRGIEITGMQALLFGTQGLNLFGEPSVRAAMLERLKVVAQVASWLGARRLVFGSPKNRDRGQLADAAALEIAVPFFRELGDFAAQLGVLFCLEPNPTRYACNFMTTTAEAAEVVRAVDSPGIRLHLDTGTLLCNDEDVDSVLAAHKSVIAHVHVSEPDLVSVGTSGADHARLGSRIAAEVTSLIASIEMLKSTKEPPTDAIRRAVKLVVDCYGRRAS